MLETAIKEEACNQALGKNGSSMEVKTSSGLS